MCSAQTGFVFTIPEAPADSLPHPEPVSVKFTLPSDHLTG